MSITTETSTLCDTECSVVDVYDFLYTPTQEIDRIVIDLTMDDEEEDVKNVEIVDLTMEEDEDDDEVTALEIDPQDDMEDDYFYPITDDDVMSDDRYISPMVLDENLIMDEESYQSVVTLNKLQELRANLGEKFEEEYMNGMTVYHNGIGKEETLRYDWTQFAREATPEYLGDLAKSITGTTTKDVLDMNTLMVMQSEMGKGTKIWYNDTHVYLFDNLGRVALYISLV